MHVNIFGGIMSDNAKLEIKGNVYELEKGAAQLIETISTPGK